jgi:hypothetical protein
MEDATIISARRSYEFAIDEIRLTLLSNRGVLLHLQQAFAFELASVGPPMEMFGPVPNTFPPGLVFDFGVAPFPEGKATPVRFIHFEQRRVVIDVAGPSSTIDFVFAMLTELLSEVRGPDGSPALGAPIRTWDYSEIKLRLPFGPEALSSQAVYSAVADALAQPAADSDAILIPVLQMRLADREDEYPGGASPSYRTFALDLRAGTKPNEHIYYSGAPLDTDAHLELLGKLEALFERGNE